MRRHFCIAVAVALLWQLGAPVAHAQPPDNGEGTLPDVVVTPPENDPLTEVNVIAPADDSGSLSNQIFGDGLFGANTGVLRDTGSIFENPGAVDIISREQIVRRQASTSMEALRNEVGILMQSTGAGQASPFVRGLTGQQVLLLIDGIRMNNSVYRFGPNQYFNTIDPGMVERIEVMRGPASVLWGSDAIGGAINVVTRSADVDYGMCCGNYRGTDFTQYYNTSNSSPYSRLNVEGWVGQTGVFAGGSFLNVRDLDTAFDFGRQPGTNYQQYVGDVKFNYLIDDNRLLTFAVQHHEQEDVIRSDRFPGFPGDLNNSNTPAGARFFEPQQRDLAYVRYQALDQFKWSDALTLTGSYHRQREILTRGIPTTTRFQETDVETVGINVVSFKDLCLLGRLSAGVDWYYDDVDSPFGGTATGPIIPDDSIYSRIGAFLNWDVWLTDRLSVVAGVRWQRIDVSSTPLVENMGGMLVPRRLDTNYSDWVGQVGCSYEINPCVRLVGSVSEGFRAPNLDELAGNNPNVLQDGMDLPSLDLEAEHAINYEVGIKTDYDRFRSQTFFFYTDLRNNIVPIVPDPLSPTNFARANRDSFIQGVEFSGEYLLQHGWSLYGNAWYLYGQNRVTNAPLSRIPPTQGIAGLRWQSSDRLNYFEIFTWLVARQDRLDPVRDISDERIPPDGTPGYGTLNVRYGEAFGCYDQHRLSLSLENITDEAYLVHGCGDFGTGFTARLGYSWVY